MFETRPAMSEEEFERLAKHREPDWWATGEGLIYQPEVMALPGWRTYGSPDNRKLTEAQRCLMVWGDIVGQVQNGGLAQFFENYASSLELANSCVAQLGWSEFSERFDLGFTDYIHVDGRDATLDEWRRHKAREQERYRQETRKILSESGDEKFAVDPEKVDWFMMMFGARGDIKIQGWDYAHIDGFNGWFYSEATKAESSARICAFALSRRDELARIA